MTATRACCLLALAVLPLAACTAETGAPDTGRGSADSPMTMMVDQVHQRAVASGGYEHFGSRTPRPVAPAGGERF